MGLVAVTGVFKTPNGAVYPSATVAFERVDARLSRNDGVVLVPDITRTFTDATGAIAVNLMSGDYVASVIASGGKASTLVTIPEAGSADIAALLPPVSGYEESVLMSILGEANDAAVAAGLSAANAALFDGPKYATRAEFVVAVAAPGWVAPSVGKIVWAASLPYRYDGATTAISDLPGFAPVAPIYGAQFKSDYTAALAWVSAQGGGEVIAATETITTTIVFSDNSTLLLPGVSLTLGVIGSPPDPDLSPVMNAWLDMSGAVNARLDGDGILNVAGNSKFAVLGVAAINPYLGAVTIKNWRYGVYICSSATVAAVNPTVRGLRLVDPNAKGAVYPFWVNAPSTENCPWVEGIDIEELYIKGVEGEYSETNQKTADQASIHGVSGGTIKNVHSLKGGEVGMTIARGSKNIVVSDCFASRNDGHGYNIGSGNYPIDVASSAGFVLGEAISCTTTAATAKVAGVFAGRLWLSTVSGGVKFENGQTILGATSAATTTIITTHRTKNISLFSCYGAENGLDVGYDPDAIPFVPKTTFADFYVQQADTIYIEGRSANSPFGIYAVTASYALGDMSYNGTVTELLATGGSTFIGPIKKAGATLLMDLRSDGRIVIGPNQTATPQITAVGSSTTQGSSFDTQGRLVTGGHATVVIDKL